MSRQKHRHDLVEEDQLHTFEILQLILELVDRQILQPGTAEVPLLGDLFEGSPRCVPRWRWTYAWRFLCDEELIAECGSTGHREGWAVTPEGRELLGLLRICPLTPGSHLFPGGEATRLPPQRGFAAMLEWATTLRRTTGQETRVRTDLVQRENGSRSAASFDPTTLHDRNQ